MPNFGYIEVRPRDASLPVARRAESGGMVNGAKSMRTAKRRVNGYKRKMLKAKRIRPNGINKFAITAGYKMKYSTKTVSKKNSQKPACETDDECVSSLIFLIDVPCPQVT
jgi:hypothetical protein